MSSASARKTLAAPAGPLLLLIVPGLLGPRCHAATPGLDSAYLQLSGGSTIVRGEAPVIDLSYIEPAGVLPHAFVQLGMQVIGHSTFHAQPVGRNILWRALFSDGFGGLGFGVGLSFMVNPPPFNGSRLNATVQMTYRFSCVPITLSYMHESNAGLRQPNYGRDALLVGWRF